MTSKDLIITDDQLHMVWIDNEPYVKFQHLQEHRQHLFDIFQPQPENNEAEPPEEEPPQPPQPSIYLEDYVRALEYRVRTAKRLYQEGDLEKGLEKLKNLEFTLNNAKDYLAVKEAT